MTIKVEQEALLRLLSAPPSTPFLEPPIRCHDGYYHIDVRKAGFSSDFPVEKLRDSSCDDDSVFTASTASLSSDSDDEDLDRRVSFAEPLVTEVWTREYTPRDDIATLYYSTEETQRFRQEYRLERKLLTDLAIDPKECPVDSDLLSNLADTTCQAQGKHRISRVVVLHNDKLETFFNNDDTEFEEKVKCRKIKQDSGNDDFFDNDSFWSGSITWF